MRYTHILILAAVFLIVGMGVQTVIMYHRATFRVQERIDIEMQIAQERFQFELYDPQDAANELDDFVEADIDRPDAIMEETRLVLERYKGLLPFERRVVLASLMAATRFADNVGFQQGFSEEQLSDAPVVQGCDGE